MWRGLVFSTRGGGAVCCRCTVNAATEWRLGVYRVPVSPSELPKFLVRTSYVFGPLGPLATEGVHFLRLAGCKLESTPRSPTSLSRPWSCHMSMDVSLNVLLNAEFLECRIVSWCQSCCIMLRNGYSSLGTFRTPQRASATQR